MNCYRVLIKTPPYQSINPIQTPKKHDANEIVEWPVNVDDIKNLLIKVNIISKTSQAES